MSRGLVFLTMRVKEQHLPQWLLQLFVRACKEALLAAVCICFL